MSISPQSSIWPISGRNKWSCSSAWSFIQFIMPQMKTCRQILFPLFFIPPDIILFIYYNLLYTLTTHSSRISGLSPSTHAHLMRLMLHSSHHLRSHPSWSHPPHTGSRCHLLLLMLYYKSSLLLLCHLTTIWLEGQTRRRCSSESVRWWGPSSLQKTIIRDLVH